jgi:FkbM family methyltransferase
MLPYINRNLPSFLIESFYWKVSRFFNKYYLHYYDQIPVKLLKNVKIRGISSDTISQQMLFQGFYDLPLSKLILNTAKKNGIFIDVGANIGYCSLLFAAGGEHCKVHSFEPAKRNLDLIEHNFKTNKLRDKVTIYPYAVSNIDDEMYFDCSSSDQTGWGHLSNIVTSEKVKVVRLDTQFKNLKEPIDLLKIDVEGFDLHVILGAKNLLKNKKINTVVFEYHKNLFIEDQSQRTDLENDFFVCIKDSGYSLSKFGDHDYILKIDKP